MSSVEKSSVEKSSAEKSSAEKSSWNRQCWNELSITFTKKSAESRASFFRESNLFAYLINYIDQFYNSTTYNSCSWCWLARLFSCNKFLRADKL